MNALSRSPVSMLLTGALAGLLSGLMMLSLVGIRGALFGFCLSLTVWFVQRGGRKALAFLPGLLLGILLGFFPMTFMEELGGEVLVYDYLTLINCAVSIPAFCWAYQATCWKGRIWKMLLVGLFSCMLRSLSLELSWQSLALVVYNFPIGMFPFLALWLGAMRLTDPRFAKDKPDPNAPETKGVIHSSRGVSRKGGRRYRSRSSHR